jgi:hypothetical protein
MEKVNLKPGSIGQWAVNLYQVQDLGHCYVLNIAHSNLVAGSKGVYTRLSYMGKVIMTDTPAEMIDHAEALERSTGSVLITGLGLGMLLRNVLKKKEVLKVVVIENSLEVIQLVGSQYQDKRLSIIHEDAFKYNPEEVFDVVWHDIWPDIYVTNIAEMKTLEERYRPFAKWQGCWASEKCAGSIYSEVREQEDAWRAKLIFEEL